jgi:SNF2 family DNA or RNA helicase
MKNGRSTPLTVPPNLPPLFEHQQTTIDFLLHNERALITSDAGTGKTRCVLEAFKQSGARRMLVLAPLSILKPAWGDDIDQWTPELTWGLSTAGTDKNRHEAFSAGCQIVITNHDAVKWLLKPENNDVLQDFDMICVDEVTAFKNPTSDRSRAIRDLVDIFERRVMMSGTITPNSVTDIWHPVVLLDEGVRLGKSFYGFRLQVCTPLQVGPNPNQVKWIDNVGAEDQIAAKIHDITLRFRFEDCIDIPEHTKNTMFIDLPPRLQMNYTVLKEQAILEAESGALINAVHAGAKYQKLLQLCSGAVYDENGDTQVFSTARSQLVMDLVAERDHSVVAFNWKHQKHELLKLADKMGIAYAVIDGGTSRSARERAVDDFQAGKLKVLFAHPASASHGLTLTKGCATIWASPTNRSELFAQFNARIYRAGQKRKTETITIAARDTFEEDAYNTLDGKLAAMGSLLDIFQKNTAFAV